jgi:hypothetical protein
MGYVILALWFACWIGFATYGLKKKWSGIISIGGGFFTACTVLAVGILIYEVFIGAASVDFSRLNMQGRHGSENGMWSIALAIFIAMSAIWVYIDATKNKIGKITNRKGMFNLSAGAWAAATLFLWIVAFPSYLINRSTLSEKAKDNPINVKQRLGKIVVLSLLGALVILFTFFVNIAPAVPQCDSIAAKRAIAKIINDTPLLRSAGTRFISIKNIIDENFNHETQVRLCSAQLSTTGGEDNIQYTIKKINNGGGAFSVTVRIK